MRRILLVLLFISPISYSCNIGVYEAIVMSEYSIQIELKKNGEMEILHKNWYGGDSIIGEEHKYIGYWKCEGTNIEIEYSVEKIVGELAESSLKEPYGIDLSSTVLSFPASVNSGSIISDWQFWPQEFVSKAFK